MFSTPAQAGNGTLADPYTSLSDAYIVPSSGRYYFNLGNGTFQADVDTSEGGGWVLVLQYVHKGNTNPNLTIIGAGGNLPQLSSASLGSDESAIAARWGHAGNAAMSQFTGDIETRWYGITSGHSRVMHFKTSIGDDYLRTGTGVMTGLPTSFTALSGHTAQLPTNVTNYFTNQGDLAMTNFPYWKSGTYHWGVKGLGSRWEVDDYANGAQLNTIHRVWVRSTTRSIAAPPVSSVCRISDPSALPSSPNFYWDSENAAPAPGQVRRNNVISWISDPVGSNTTIAGPGITYNTLSNRTTISNVDAKSLGEARALGEYLQQSFTTTSNFGGYLKALYIYSAVHKIGVDIATQPNFSDAVNYFDGDADFIAGWDNFTGTGRQILLPGKTYYVRFYFYGVASGDLDGWGFEFASCMDHGDAPLDTSAFHVQQGNLWIGATAPDLDNQSLHTVGSAAGGDDASGTDDEDIAGLPVFTGGTTQNISVIVNQPSANAGRLQAWIDWNNDGDFLDASEQIATNLTYAGGTSGAITVPVTVPVNVTAGTTYARFRWSTATSLNSADYAPDGEIEDIAVQKAVGLPNLVITKSAKGYNGGSTGLKDFYVPGNDVLYEISVQNTGPGQPDPGTIQIIDALPSELVFYYGDMDGAGPGTDPVQFTATSGSSLNFDPNIQLKFASAAPSTFADCTYNPTPGYDPAIRYVCFETDGTLPGNGSPAYQASFKFRAKIE